MSIKGYTSYTVTRKNSKFIRVLTHTHKESVCVNSNMKNIKKMCNRVTYLLKPLFDGHLRGLHKEFLPGIFW